MSTYTNRLQPALQNLLQLVVQFFHPRLSCRTHILADVFGGRKITRKASGATENLQLYRVVRFFHPRSSCGTTHISADISGATRNLCWGVLMFPSRPLPLEVGPQIQLGGLGERCKVPQRGLGRSPSRNRLWCIFSLKIRHLVATILRIFVRVN